MHAYRDVGGRAGSGTGRRGGRAVSGTKAGESSDSGHPFPHRHDHRTRHPAKPAIYSPCPAAMTYSVFLRPLLFFCLYGLAFDHYFMLPPPPRCQPSRAKKPKKTRDPPRVGRFSGFQSGKKRRFSSLKPARDGRMTTGRRSVSGPVYTISAAPADCVQDHATRHGLSLIRRE